MVHKHIYGYFSQHKVEEMVVRRSIHDFLQDIRFYKKKYNKAPKILISLRAFDELYNWIPDKVIFGYRFNKIMDHFANILRSLKYSGAELIFVSKNAPSNDDKERILWNINESFISAKILLEKFEAMEDPMREFYNVRKDLTKLLRGNLILALAHVAQKFGVFRENDCLIRVSTSGHVQTANNEDFYAIIGNETAYLTRPGSWRYLSPAKYSNNQKDNFIFDEFDKMKILKHFKCNYEQFQLFSLLGRRFFSTDENNEILKSFFDIEVGDRSTTDFPKIAEFVHKYAPPEKFPLRQEIFEEISNEIFGYSDDVLTADFMDSFQYGVYFYENACRFEDMEVNLMLTNDPFSSLAEHILNGLQITITEPFLDATASDMKPLQDLTFGWIKRFAGVLLKYVEKPKKFIIACQSESGVEIEAEEPDFEIPNLKQLISEEINKAQKFKILAFIIDNIITEKDLKAIPPDYLMHVIIAVHLVKHNSMTLIEAIAMTNAMRYIFTKSYTRFPGKINIRAFRVSALYQKMYSILLMCLSPIGLKSFIAELTIDNVQFQNIYCELNDWSTAYKNVDDENPFDLIMEVINR